MSSSKKSSASGFGRDEMNLLLGVTGGTDESKAGLGTAGSALLQTRGYYGGSKSSDNKRGGEIDIASLSTAETAALLQQQQQQKKKKKMGAAAGQSQIPRYRAHRTQKRMQHHELLEQELKAQQEQQQQKQQQRRQEEEERKEAQETDEEEEDGFATAKHKRRTAASSKRIQLEPQIIVQKGDAATRRRRRRSSSSSNSSGEDETPTNRRGRRPRRDSSSSNENFSPSVTMKRQQRKRSPSSSSSEDEARQRRLKKRQQLEGRKSEETSVKRKEGIVTGDKLAKASQVEEKKVEIPETQFQQMEGKETKEISRMEKRKDKSSSEASSSDAYDDESSDSSSSSSSSEDEPTPAIAKPLFVPKHKRQQLAQEKLELEKNQQEREQTTKQQEEKRKMESRSLVAQVVAASSAPADEGAVSEDEDVKAERMLNDKDDLNPEEERDLWEVRELERLLLEIDRFKKREQDQAEYRRRQQLTDEEARAEDIASGRYQKPGSNRIEKNAENNKDGPKYLQKYFHRGAYYMDEDEFDEDDVRRRAKEYEQGITESAKEKGNIRKLPKVMQVKQFGRANQSRYQGLSKEDTSRKDSSTLLPLVYHKDPLQRKTTDIPTKKHKKREE